MFVMMTISLIACSSSENTIKQELPVYSSGLESFVGDHITKGIGHYLFTVDQQQIYAKENLGSQEREIEYIQYSENQFEEATDELLSSENLGESFRDLWVNESLYESVDPDSYDQLPIFHLKDANVLEIETNEAVQTFNLADLLEDYDVNKDDKLIINLWAVGKSNFQFETYNHSNEELSLKEISMFMTNDFEDVLVTQTYTKDFLNDVLDGKTEPFKNLLVQLDEDNRYLKAVDSHTIIDLQEKKLIEIDEADYVSNDFSYVYIGGNADPINEGNQQIQKIEDYLSGNEEYVMEFDLDFKEIDDELDLNSTNSVSPGRVVYLTEDFLVLYLNFKGAITGKAGSTNVIVDFQEDRENPTFYLVDLGLEY